MLKIAIVDDQLEFSCYFEKILSDNLRKLMINHHIVKIDSIKTYSDTISKFDFVFLDIMMDDIISYEQEEIVKRMHSEKIVYMSSHDTLLFQTMHISPFDCIRKSTINDELHIIAKKIKESYINMHYFSVMYLNQKISIKCSEIIYFENQKNYIIFQKTNGEKIKIRYTLIKLLEQIEKRHYNEFVKINRSIVVNSNHCKKIEQNEVKTIDGESLPISIRNKKSIINKLISRMI